MSFPTDLLAFLSHYVLDPFLEHIFDLQRLDSSHQVQVSLLGLTTLDSVAPKQIYVGLTLHLMASHQALLALAYFDSCLDFYRYQISLAKLFVVPSYSLFLHK